MFTDGDRVLLNALHAKLMDNQKLTNMARTSDPQIFTESIFPKAFGDAAQDSYMESQETYTTLFEDQHKYNAIMSALAEGNLSGDAEAIVIYPFKSRTR